MQNSERGIMSFQKWVTEIATTRQIHFKMNHKNYTINE